jgi:hypothetical protein
MNDAQTWSVIAIFAAIFAGQFVELRSDRRDFRVAFQRIDDRFAGLGERLSGMDERLDQRFREIDGRLGTIEVTTARIDEHLRGVETRS